MNYINFLFFGRQILCTLQTDDEGSLTWDDHHLDMIRKWSAAAESLIHGRASGLDAAVCTYGTTF